MAFLVPRDALTPRRLAASLDPAARVLRGDDHAVLVQAQALLDNAHAQARAILAGAQEAFEAERERVWATVGL